MLQMHVERGVHVYCADCNDMASYNLSEHNEHFYEWVKMLESKYGDEEYADLDLDGGASNGYFSARDRIGDQLQQRCRAIGAKMSLEQKQLERYAAANTWGYPDAKPFSEGVRIVLFQILPSFSDTGV